MEGLARLTTLTNLSRLRIGQTKVTDAGLSHLALMPRMDTLGTRRSAGRQTPASEALLKLSRLKALDLSGTKIDDGALATLAKFPMLAELNVRDTRVTPSCDGALSAGRTLASTSSPE